MCAFEVQLHSKSESFFSGAGSCSRVVEGFFQRHGNPHFCAHTLLHLYIMRKMKASGASFKLSELHLYIMELCLQHSDSAVTKVVSEA